MVSFSGAKGAEAWGRCTRHAKPPHSCQPGDSGDSRGLGKPGPTGADGNRRILQRARANRGTAPESPKNCITVDEIDRAVAVLEAVGFKADRHEWSVNFRGRSQVSLQLSTEDF